MNFLRITALLAGITLGLSCRPAPAEQDEVRPPAFAGSFYPADPGRLARDVDALLAAAPAPAPDAAPPRALIAPHAGYVYSGAVAAHAYRLVSGQTRPTVILIGSSHRAAYPGAALWPAGVFRTPLGDIPIATNLTRKLLDRGRPFVALPAAHLNDHVLEVHLPFLQRTLDNFTLVPIMMGNPDAQTARLVGEALAELAGPDALVIASTDLSHYPVYHDAVAADAKTIAAILTGDPDQLAATLRAMAGQPPPNTSTFMCSEGAVLAAMTFARSIGTAPPVLLNYANSGDAPIGDKHRVVGYVSIAFPAAAATVPPAPQPDQEPPPMTNANDFSPEERQELLRLARHTVESVVKSGKPPPYTPALPGLERPRGAFVTINKNGQLRGCIGHFEADNPIWQTVINMATAAATQDPRFPQVAAKELDALSFEISVLSPLRKISDWREIELGKHGVQIARGFRRGVFLPQVATDTGWDLDTFMGQLCSQKAGLPWDAWKDPQTDLYVFTAEIFSETGSPE